MKIEKTNNPLAVGALVLVLTLIIGRILWMLLGHDSSVSAASPLVATALPTTPVAAGRTKPTLSLAVVPKTARNPFSFFAAPPQARAPTVASPKPARSQVHAAT
ncbi:MAG: hypothetical protein M3Y13_10025, partial [Armatimonadota bacterium]|nr:hypothetical protein [Armatimonadota bacterium]